VARFLAILLLIFTSALSPALAQTPAPEKRVALVIGAAAYSSIAPLDNPVNDARAVAASLRATGFSVTELIDPNDQQAFGRALSVFRASAAGADAAVIYYAGHGVEVEGTNWLLPVGVNMTGPEDLEFSAVRAGSLADAVRGARRLRMVILDACRDNPFAAKRSFSAGGRSIGSRGLSRMDSVGNVVVLIATQAGSVAADGRGQTNSPFATALAKVIREPGVRAQSLPSRVSRAVQEATGTAQRPDQSGIFDDEDWAFVPTSISQSLVQRPVTPDPAQLDALYWQGVMAANTKAAFEDYISRYPSGQFASLAQQNVARFSAAPPPPMPIPSIPAVSARPQIQSEFSAQTWGLTASDFDTLPARSLLDKFAGGQSVSRARIRELEGAAQRGDPYAVYLAGWSIMYFGGFTERLNSNRLNPLWKASAEGGLVAAMVPYGVKREQEGSIPDAIRWFRYAAEAGNQVGQMNLAWRLENGVGVTRNPQEALRWAKGALAGSDAGLKRSAQVLVDKLVAEGIR
jgi:Caspase domain